MKPELNIDKIAKVLRAEHRGPLTATSGYFGATQLAAEVRARFHVPSGGGRPTDPSWSERRQVPLAPKTLSQLERLAQKVSEQSGTKVEALQVAGLLIEQAVSDLTDAKTAQLVVKARASSG